MLVEIFCSFCKHVESARKNNKACCKAFPNGIPYEILFASQLHNKILPEQEGDYIFTPKEGYEEYTPKVKVPEKDGDLPLVVSLAEFMKKLREYRENDENNEQL